jgi:hypothetical protein
MSQFYTGLASTAAALLKDKGQLVSFVTRTRGDFDPATGTYDDTEVEYEGYGAVFEYSVEEIDGSTILQGDAKLLVQNMTRPVAAGDTAILATGEVWRVVDAGPLAPGGVTVITKCQLRRGAK